MKKVGFPYKEHRPQFGWLAGWRVGWLIRLLVSTCEYSLGWKQRKIHLKEKQQQQSMKKRLQLLVGLQKYCLPLRAFCKTLIPTQGIFSESGFYLGSTQNNEGKTTEQRHTYT